MKGRWNFSALCRQKVTGWTSPTFRVQFIVRADDEEEARMLGDHGMRIARSHLEYQKVELIELEKGDPNVEDPQEAKAKGEEGLRTLAGLHRVE